MVCFVLFFSCKIFISFAATLFNLTGLSPEKTILAHTSELAAVRFSKDGKLLATASTKGTVIRVFNVETGDKLFEFSRGMKRLVL